MNFFELTMDLTPYPKGRPRFWKGRAVTPEKTRRYEREVATLIRYAFGARPPFQGALKITLQFHFTRPKKPANPFPSRADTDNLIKAVTDSANGIVWKDDTQIVDLHARKLYSPVNAVYFKAEQVPL